MLSPEPSVGGPFCQASHYKRRSWRVWAFSFHLDLQQGFFFLSMESVWTGLAAAQRGSGCLDIDDARLTLLENHIVSRFLQPVDTDEHAGHCSNLEHTFPRDAGSCRPVDCYFTLDFFPSCTCPRLSLSLHVLTLVSPPISNVAHASCSSRT